MLDQIMGRIDYYRSQRVKNIDHRNINLYGVMASADCLISRKNLVC